MTYVEWIAAAEAEARLAIPGAKLSTAQAYDAWKRGDSPEEFARDAAVRAVQTGHTKSHPQAHALPAYPAMWGFQIASYGVNILAVFLIPPEIPRTTALPGYIILAVISMIFAIAALSLAIRSVIAKSNISDQVSGWIIISWDIAAFVWAIAVFAKL